MNKKDKQEKKQGQLTQALRENLKRRKQQPSVVPPSKVLDNSPEDENPRDSNKD